MSDEEGNGVWWCCTAVSDSHGVSDIIAHCLVTATLSPGVSLLSKCSDKDNDDLTPVLGYVIIGYDTWASFTISLLCHMVTPNLTHLRRRHATQAQNFTCLRRATPPTVCRDSRDAVTLMNALKLTERFLTAVTTPRMQDLLPAFNTAYQPSFCFPNYTRNSRHPHHAVPHQV